MSLEQLTTFDAINQFLEGTILALFFKLVVASTYKKVMNMP